MGNIISTDGVDVDVDMSNGGTEVFVEVMMLAVSGLARREWDFRFAARIAGMDQTKTAFDTSTATTPDRNRFLDFNELVVASCVRHRVLAPLPEYRECVFCTNDWG
jgi:hypothetical protein